MCSLPVGHHTNNVNWHQQYIFIGNQQKEYSTGGMSLRQWGRFKMIVLNLDHLILDQAEDAPYLSQWSKLIDWEHLARHFLHLADNL